MSESGFRRVKMRKCFSGADAARMSARLSKLNLCPCAPTLLGLHEEWLFMHFFDMPEAVRVNGMEFWEAVGRAVADFERVPAAAFDVNFAGEREAVLPKDMSAFVRAALSELKTHNLAPHSFGTELVSFLDDLPACCHGYLDLLAGNVLGSGERIVFADEEGFAGCIPGMSFVRPLDIWHRYIPGIGICHQERAWMLGAYAENGGDLCFFNSFYRQISRLYYLLKTYDSFLATGKSAESLKRLVA